MRVGIGPRGCWGVEVVETDVAGAGAGAGEVVVD